MFASLFNGDSGYFLVILLLSTLKLGESFVDFKAIKKYCSCARMIELIFNIETYKLQNNPSTSIRKRSSARVFQQKLQAAIDEATEIIESDPDILTNPINDFQSMMNDVDQESNMMRHWEINATYQILLLNMNN